MAIKKELMRGRRHARIRKRVSGTQERPRLSVFGSSSHMYAQIIDDTNGTTMAMATSLGAEMKEWKGHKGNVAAAKEIGKIIGKMALDKGIKKVVFDRGGNLYHGRVKALAEAAREAGLDF